MNFSVTEFVTKRIASFIALGVNIANSNGVNYQYITIQPAT